MVIEESPDGAIRRTIEALVWSVDQKSGVQAKSGVNATKPAVPGYPAGRSSNANVRRRPAPCKPQ
jgi:hypothetical protein